MIIKKLQEELDKNEEYKDLLLERKEILRSNGFINKLQPRFEAICERLQEIDNETQKKLWGEVVLKDSEDEDMSKPIGVSEYHLCTDLPLDLKNALPAVEDIRSRIDMKK